MKIVLNQNGNEGVFELMNEENKAVGELTFIVKNQEQMIINHTGVNPEYTSVGAATAFVLKCKITSLRSPDTSAGKIKVLLTPFGRAPVIRVCLLFNSV